MFISRQRTPFVHLLMALSPKIKRNKTEKIIIIVVYNKHILQSTVAVHRDRCVCVRFCFCALASFCLKKCSLLYECEFFFCGSNVHASNHSTTHSIRYYIFFISFEFRGFGQSKHKCPFFCVYLKNRTRIKNWLDSQMTKYINL